MCTDGAYRSVRMIGISAREFSVVKFGADST
jgi:hypothetical protein